MEKMPVLSDTSLRTEKEFFSSDANKGTHETDPSGFKRELLLYVPAAWICAELSTQALHT